jgi:hypothetical protein
MGSFGNDMGATFGGEMYSSKANNWSNDEWKALMGKDKPANYWDQIDQDNVAKLGYDQVKPDPNVQLTPDSNLLGVVPGLLTDDTTYNAVGDELNGGNALNWESWTFGDLRAERNALNPGAIGQLAIHWQGHGDDLKEKSGQFKKDVTKAITGHWTGASAEAAEAASAQVTKTSIYDFTPSSDALYNRLTVLETAFNYIQNNFPHGDVKLIDKFDEYDKHDLDQKVAEYNSKYHFDGEGHLRLSNGQYVDVSTAIDEAERIRNSIKAYQTAVALFDKTYNPTVEAVTDNFPTLPPPPDMTFKAPSPGGPGGPGTGPGTGPGGGPGGLPKLGGSPDLKNMAGLKPSDLPKIPDTKLTDPKLPDTNLPDTQTTDPTTSTGQDGLSGLTGPLSSAMNAAKDAIGQAADAAKGAGQGLQDPNLGGPQGPPEGVLGLGPQGLGGGGAGKGAGGVGGLGAMPKGLANAAPMSAPATAAAKVPAAAAGAGLASGAGSPGAGAPAAGQRGGDQNGKGHQVNKALRRKKNGKDVIGDAEAAVPVVGAPENQGQTEGLQIDGPDQPEQSDGTTTSAGPTPRRVPRPRQPMQIPGL